MALKDWKKAGKDTWRNKKITELGVRSIGILSKSKNKKIKYDVIQNIGWTNTVKIKNLKTKSQALKYAKQYMRRK